MKKPKRCRHVHGGHGRCILVEDHESKFCWPEDIDPVRRAVVMALADPVVIDCITRTVKLHLVQVHPDTLRGKLR